MARPAFPRSLSEFQARSITRKHASVISSSQTCQCPNSRLTTPKSRFPLQETQMTFGSYPLTVERTGVYTKRNARPFALWPEGHNNEIYFSSERDKEWEVWTTDPDGNEQFVFRSTVDAISVLICDRAHIYYLKIKGRWEADLPYLPSVPGKISNSHRVGLYVGPKLTRRHENSVCRL